MFMLLEQHPISFKTLVPPLSTLMQFLPLDE